MKARDKTKSCNSIPLGVSNNSSCINYNTILSFHSDGTDYGMKLTCSQLPDNLPYKRNDNQNYRVLLKSTKITIYNFKYHCENVVAIKHFIFTAGNFERHTTKINVSLAGYYYKLLLCKCK